MSSNKLTKFLTTPSKIASTLEWNKLRGSVLALDIHHNEIGLTLASHPLSAGTHNVQTSHLESLPLTFCTTTPRRNRKVVESAVVAQLGEIVRSHRVCGFVVNWPLQKEGRLGASCGRVLHTLDCILEESSSSSSSSSTDIFSPNRKFCLWDGSHVEIEQDDSFGRCSMYGTPSTTEEAGRRHVHLASTEQYHQERVVVDIWDDFCHKHWPMLFENNNEPLLNSEKKKDVVFDEKWLDVFDENDGYMQALAL